MNNVRIKKGNGEEIKVKVFTKNDLSEKLGFNKEELNLIMKYQKKFPELLQNTEGCNIDARDLWKELNEPQGKFANWIKRKVISKGFTEDIDYIRFHKTVKGDSKGYGNKSTEEYNLTIDTAKHVAMMENTLTGSLIRNYFILTEKALRKMDEWIIIREPEKLGYKELCKQLDLSYFNKHKGKTPNHLYSNEANMINRALLGKDAKTIREFLGTKDNQTREHLNAELNQSLYELQILDSGLIISGLDYYQRKEIIESVCNTKYKLLKFNITTEYLKIA